MAKLRDWSNPDDEYEGAQNPNGLMDAPQINPALLNGWGNDAQTQPEPWSGASDPGYSQPPSAQEPSGWDDAAGEADPGGFAPGSYDPSAAVSAPNVTQRSPLDYSAGAAKSWLGEHLNNPGLPMQSVMDMFNEQFGRTHGNEAVWYDDSQSIGLPEFYMSKNGNGWDTTDRTESIYDHPQQDLDPLPSGPDFISQMGQDGSGSPQSNEWGPDPFTAMGGGVRIAGGGWVPRNNPLAEQGVDGNGYVAGPGAPQQEAPQGPGRQAPLAADSNDTAPGYDDPFAPGGPMSDPVYNTPTVNGPAGGPASQPGAPPGAPNPGDSTDVRSIISQMLANGGQLNNDAIDNRSIAARERMEQVKRGRMESLNADLANRGLTGSGAEANALGNLEGELGSTLGSDLNDIFADEGDKADSRLMSTLALATGMSTEDAKNLLTARGQDITKGLGDASNSNVRIRNANDYTLGTQANQNQSTRNQNDYDLGHEANSTQRDLGMGNLDNDRLGLEIQRILGEGGLRNQADANATNRDLGFGRLHLDDKLGTGQLALGNLTANMTNNNNIARLGLDRDVAGNNITHTNTQDLLGLLQLLLGGGDQANGGHV